MTKECLRKSKFRKTKIELLVDTQTQDLTVGLVKMVCGDTDQGAEVKQGKVSEDTDQGARGK